MYKNLVLNQLDLNQNRMNLTANVVQVSKIVNHWRPIRTVEYDFKNVLNVGMTQIVWAWWTSQNHRKLGDDFEAWVPFRDEFISLLTQWVGNSRWKFCTWNDAHQTRSSKPLPSTRQFYSSHYEWNAKWLKVIIIHFIWCLMSSFFIGGNEK